MSPPFLAVLGVGPWGRNHCRVLDAHGWLRAAHDIDGAALMRVAPEFRRDSLQAVLDDPGVRGVIVATPARTHFEIARAALLAGKDVLVEKPLTLDEAEGEELARLSRRLGRVLMVGHITLYHPALVQLRQLLRAGELGRIRYLYSNRLNLGTVRESEDILWSFAPHDIAAFLDLTGHWPLRVGAHGGSYLRAGRADVTVTHLEFPEGIRGHIFVSWLHPTKEHRLVVVGEQRMAAFTDDRMGGSLTLFDAGAIAGGTLNVAARDQGRCIEFPREEPLANELAHFVARMEDRAEPLTGARHGLEVLRVLETARQSLLEGGIALDCVALEAGCP
ncbi:MAG: Gfo/Idh/MocA family oxidoreductase [Planctomycetes bacterium]|nr:Gfo/Idh/MocA family oxidoreductase [Planctomycetota bacterium]